MEGKIKVVPFNSLPIEEREKLTYYIELHRIRGMEQVRHLLKDDIGKNQQKKILDWEQDISDRLDREYEVITE
jgi:hypothetical protein